MSTTAQLTYTIPPADGSRPYTAINEDSTGKKSQNWIEDIRNVDIEDARGKEHQYTLDTVGFQFHHYRAKHTRFLDDEEIKGEYYTECMELLKELTGATKVVIFDHTIRRRRPGITDDDQQKRQPVPLVHSDRTTASSIARVHKHLPPSEVEDLLRGRWQIINIWRPISHPAVDWPLAFCDYRSVNPDNDLVVLALVHHGHEGENYHLKYNPEHRWVYKRAMDTEDVVLIKCFDSISDDSVAKMAAHSALKDPKTPEGTPFRESIEVEALVFYKED